MKKKSPSQAKSTRKAAEKPVLIDGVLIGWPTIAKYLGQPVAVAQRWAKDGMPVERKGRSMTARSDELSKWLGKEVRQEAVHIAQAADDDMLTDLRRALREARKTKT